MFTNKAHKIPTVPQESNPTHAHTHTHACSYTNKQSQCGNASHSRNYPNIHKHTQMSPHPVCCTHEHACLQIGTKWEDGAHKHTTVGSVVVQRQQRTVVRSKTRKTTKRDLGKNVCSAPEAKSHLVHNVLQEYPSALKLHILSCYNSKRRTGINIK